MGESESSPKHLQIGEIGEDIATKWLTDKGFSVLERNYTRKWGELDIIAEKDREIHFVEVKTVSYETVDALEREVSRGTDRPEENVHFKKQQRLGRAIQTWIAKHNFSGNFQIDVLTVRLVPREKYAVIDVIENVILE